MAKKQKRNFRASPKKLSITGGIAALALFVLVLLNEAMGTNLPLPSVGELQELLDGAYTSTGLSAPPAQVEGGLTVHYIDVEQADCELIQTEEQNVLIDAGDQGMGDQIGSYLRAQGVETIDLLIATHPHADHIGSMAEIVKQFEIKKVLFAEVPDSLTPTSKTYERLLDAIADKRLKITKAQPGNRYELGGGAVLDILGPQRKYENDLNDNSVVCRVAFGERAFLFTGDAGKDSEDDMMDAYSMENFRADVLKLGHHGSSTANQEKWVKAVQPSLAIASCGYDNKYGHPHREVVQLMEKMKIPLYRTYETGTVVVHTDGESLEIHKEKE